MTAAKETGKNVPVKLKEKTGGIQYHLSLLASSIKSFGKILTERKKTAKKPEEINKLLEQTITEKVSKGSALDSAATVPVSVRIKPWWCRGRITDRKQEMSPIRSCHSRMRTSEPACWMGWMNRNRQQDQKYTGIHGCRFRPFHAGSDMPALPDETTADADAILRANADDDVPIELNSLEGGEAADETLGDLDNINLDDIDLGDDSGMQDPTPQTSAPRQRVRPWDQEVSFRRPPSRLPGGSYSSDYANQTEDMSSFAAGTATGSDDDMLSSLASDIKHVTKEKDVSLLRELKDFKAPATDIEKELLEMSEQLNASKGATKKTLSTKSVK